MVVSFFFVTESFFFVNKIILHTDINDIDVIHKISHLITKQKQNRQAFCTLLMESSNTAIPSINLIHSLISGLCGLFQLCKINLAAAIKPVIISLTSALVIPGGMRDLSPNRHNCGDPSKGLSEQPYKINQYSLIKRHYHGTVP